MERSWFGIIEMVASATVVLGLRGMATHLDQPRDRQGQGKGGEEGCCSEKD